MMFLWSVLLLSVLLPASKVWLGFNDFVREGKYVWTSTSEVLKFTHWSPGEPNNLNIGAGDQDCGVLYANGLWDDDACENVQYPFLCEKTPEEGGEMIG